jgi:hypothetical protein
LTDLTFNHRSPVESKRAGGEGAEGIAPAGRRLRRSRAGEKEGERDRRDYLILERRTEENSKAGNSSFFTVS